MLLFYLNCATVFESFPSLSVSLFWILFYLVTNVTLYYEEIAGNKTEFYLDLRHTKKVAGRFINLTK